ncbi:MAG: PQQ-binding-like beta-propeller repeat protein [Pirellulales bacterium]
MRRRSPSGLVLTALTVSCLIGGIAETQAADPVGKDYWPQWRGPLATGVAPSADPPAEWSETKNVKWKVKLPGHGASTPVIWDNMVLIHAAISVETKPAANEEATQGDAASEDVKAEDAKAEDAKADGARPQQDRPRPDRERPGGSGRGGPGGRGGFGSVPPTQPYRFVAMAIDRQTGKTIWQKTLKEELPHEGHHRDHGYSSFSPVTDGKRIVSYFGSRGLYCLDMAGNVQWSKELGKMKTRAGFGEGSSPALYGNAIVVNWDHEGDDFIAAFNVETGDELWRNERDEPTSWSTPLVVEHDGRPQVITSATNRVCGYDLASGTLLWECSGLTTNAIPSPVYADGVVYATTGYRGSALLAIKLGQTGDLTDTDSVLWKLERNTPYVPSPLLYGNRLYLFKSNDATLSCFDATTGKVLIDQVRLSGLRGAYASPVGAGDKVYLVGRNGTSMVIKNADKLETLATNELDEPIDASPAAVGKELFLRGHDSLYCIAE